MYIWCFDKCTLINLINVHFQTDFFAVININVHKFCRIYIIYLIFNKIIVIISKTKCTLIRLINVHFLIAKQTAFYCRLFAFNYKNNLPTLFIISVLCSIIEWA